MLPPTNIKTYEGELAIYWFEDGILVSLSKNVLRTVENLEGNAALVKEITGNKPVPALIYIQPSPIPEKQTKQLVKTQFPQIFTAVAMVSRPAFFRFAMNILFKTELPDIPIKSFTDEKAAKEWLKQYI